MKYLRVTLQKFPSTKPVVVVRTGNPEPFQGPNLEPSLDGGPLDMRPALEVTIVAKPSQASASASQPTNISG